MNCAVHHDVLSKVPEVTLVFSITKVAATTLETGGDSVTMALDWGYLVGTLLFLGLLIALVIAQIVSEKFHPFLFSSIIVASTTFGTTMADFADRSLGIGYTGGSSLLFACLMIALALWYRSEGKLSRLRQEIAALTRKSHRTKARLGGYSERRVCSVVSMPAGGASRREECWNHFALPAQRRSGLGGLWDDAARTTRCGGACQAGEPRALAVARRRAASPQISAAGQADAIPTLIRRTLNCTKAPILSNLRRMLPQVALAKCV